MNKKRLTQIETTLTPRQAVLFWIRQEIRGRTADEYACWLLHQPASAAPRCRVENQVVAAIRDAMKGQDPVRIRHAVRQGQMQTDFLILLIQRTNRVVIDNSQIALLRISWLYERIFHASLVPDKEKMFQEWADCLKLFAINLFEIQGAVERIQERYFGGECILFQDALDDLNWHSQFMRNLMAAHDGAVAKAGQPEDVLDSETFRSTVKEKAIHVAELIAAVAKSGTLDEFGEHEASDALLRPYFPEASPKDSFTT